MRLSTTLFVASLSCAATLPLAGAHADDFYRGKTITILVGGTAGGGFDTISRVMSTHLGKYIPGNPSFVVRDVPGGGGIVVANTIYNVAPKDGTQMAYIGPVVVQPLLSPDNKSIQFDATKITWIGSLGVTSSVLIAWHETPFKTAQDLFDKQMVVAGTGAASTTDIYPKVLNAVLGTKFKLITGYQGSKETYIAIERKEADGRFSALDSIYATVPDWIPSGKARVILQASVNRQSDLPDIPTAVDLAKTDDQRQALDFTFLPSEMGRPIAAPPGIPNEQKSILRTAFAKMIADPSFLAEAKQRGIEVNGPMTGEQVEAAVTKIYATPKAVVDQVIKAMQ
ncbi:MAG TPA: tripartite tricarboxylate transporter substrate-binding protein [Alphaproteobacteria bacterium]|jgi:tripartite-type tricarboxylate transporter receptor subunit TctC|nr:tripartite tricarboxylate transporter substrate-binding protein [Alphaproteobacteria bacterium]